MIMQCRCHVFACVRVEIGNDDARQELDNRHGHMRSMLKAMKWIGTVHGRDCPHIFYQLLDSPDRVRSRIQIAFDE